ncbi:MAG: hypothetical protein WCE30_03365 [Mycobacterium sp.]
MEMGEPDMSVHAQIMGNPTDRKALAYRELLKYYRDRGWTYDAQPGGVDVFEPPANATPEDIAEVARGADALIASFGLGVH